MIKLIRKIIEPDKMEVLYNRPFTAQSLEQDFDIKSGEWYVEDGWLTGKNPGNFPGMAVMKRPFYDNVMLDFEARTVLPCTHDINVMWNGSWDERENKRSVAYVTGIQGWWDGKVGFEKSPDYLLNVGTKLFDFEPGKIYHMQAGSINGHIFVIIGNALVLEITDPDPIDCSKYGQVGFEAYCSFIQFRNLKVRKASFVPHETEYVPEFI